MDILTLNKISPAGLDRLEKNGYNCGNNVENPDAIIVRSAKMHDMEFKDNTLAIGRAGAGVNNIPIDKCTDQGIVVFNTPGANANAVKELVICAMLLSSRKIVPGIKFTETLKGKGDAVAKMVEKEKSAFKGPEIKGKTLGVIGLGAIGIQVANAATSLGMEVYGYDPYISVDAAWNISSRIHHAENPDEIFENCDYITLHIPLNDQTKNIVDKKAISNMKDGIRIMNFARGGLVNTDDIIEALGKGKVAAYATDFVEDKLINVPGVITIPHLGASTPESEDNCARMAALELMDYLENGNIKNSVNMPEADMNHPDTNRLCVIHKNIPNVLNKITGEFTDANIRNFLNRSRGDIAYTMMDLDSEISEDQVNLVRNLPGVIRVRLIKGN